MTLFFTSDPHLFHDNIIKYCNRPFKNVEKMHRALKKNWNKVVEDGDEVWVLGDFTLKTGKHKQLLQQIVHGYNGTKHLVLAPTHDLMLPRDYEEIGFTSVHYPAMILPNGWYLGHDPALASVWPSGSIYICGHVHKLMKSQISRTGVLMINSGVDVRDFTPMSEDQIHEIIANGPEDPQEDSKEGSTEPVQDENCSNGVQQERCLCHGKDKQPSIREKRWREARGASIAGTGTPKRDYKNPALQSGITRKDSTN